MGSHPAEAPEQHHRDVENGETVLQHGFCRRGPAADAERSGGTEADAESGASDGYQVIEGSFYLSKQKTSFMVRGLF